MRKLAVLLALALAARPAGAAAPTGAAPDFTLTDQRGRPFTLSAQRGHPVVLFFGYTNCPDVCPTLLAHLAHAKKAAGAAASDLVVALITVDPARDTAHELGRYVALFDPSFLGLRGSDAQLQPIYRAYHVRYEREAGNGPNYAVSHTAFVYYIGRRGAIEAFGTWDDNEDILQETLHKIAAR